MGFTGHPDGGRNRRVMDEFRANGGRVRLTTVAEGVPEEALAGLPTPTLLILHTTGAKSGLPRENPLAYQAVGDAFAVFASNGARPENPSWYHNLLAHPRARIEVGSETFDVRARVAEGAERDQIWEWQKATQPGFAAYETQSPRTIPVVILERIS